MDQVYSGQGVRFRYPEDWELSEESGPAETSISVRGPGTAFWMLSLIDGNAEPEDVLQTAVNAFQEEYPDLDIYETSTPGDDPSARCVELGFLCFELTNSAFLRAFRTGQVTALVIYQATDHELDDVQAQLETITHSLVCSADQS